MILCDVCKQDITNSYYKYNQQVTVEPYRVESLTMCQTCYKYHDKLEEKAKVIAWQMTKRNRGKL